MPNFQAGSGGRRLRKRVRFPCRSASYWRHHALTDAHPSQENRPESLEPNQENFGPASRSRDEGIAADPAQRLRIHLSQALVDQFGQGPGQKLGELQECESGN